MIEFELVGGPRCGDRLPASQVLAYDLYFAPQRPRLRAYVTAPTLADMEPLRVHVYEREHIDGHPTLSLAYRGLR